MAMNHRMALGTAAAFFLFASPAWATDTSLDPVFGDHMVLQRDAAVRVWGRSDPGTRVTVSLAGESARATTDDNGDWSLELPAQGAGGPHELTVRSDDGVQTIGDILFGDVFLCSGQSNMEWPVSRSSGAWGDLLAPLDDVRLLTIVKDVQPAPIDDHANAPQWVVSSAETIPPFSAVCWFMARELRNDIDVPMGLINASWGGSQIEAWMSESSLRRVDGFDEPLNLLAAYAADRSEGLRRFGEAWEAWWHEATPGSSPWESGQGEVEGWRPVPAAMGDWKAYGDPELADHQGMLWFRNEFRLTADQAAQSAVLALGSVDEVDATWVSGRFAGAGFGWGTPREYTLPRGFLQAGDNSVTINVLNTWGQGGLLGPPDQLRLRLEDGSEVPLGEGWRYRKPAAEGLPPRTPWESVGGLTGMYNAMIAPLEGLQLAGAAWYQGESNAGRGRAYEALLHSMIGDWRNRFGHPSLPFVVVQLPGFGAMTTKPIESGWAELRESQRRVAVADPHTGLASIMDVGDPYDIHPTNKAVAGRRVAGVLRSLLYGERGVPDGLSAISARRVGDEVVVDFSAAGDLPVVRGSGSPAGFELCSDEPQTCAWADARLDGSLVRLSGANAATATKVRHAWADTPIVNLYSEGGLPVGSFEVPVSD